MVDNFYTFILQVFNISRSAVTFDDNQRSDDNDDDDNDDDDSSTSITRSTTRPSSLSDDDVPSSNSSRAISIRSNGGHRIMIGDVGSAAGNNRIRNDVSSVTGGHRIMTGAVGNVTGVNRVRNGAFAAFAGRGSTAVPSISSTTSDVRNNGSGRDSSSNIRSTGSSSDRSSNSSNSSSSSSTVLVSVAMSNGRTIQLSIPTLESFEAAFERRLMTTGFDVTADDPFQRLKQQVPAFRDLFPHPLPPSGSPLSAPFAPSRGSPFFPSFGSRHGATPTGNSPVTRIRQTFNRLFSNLSPQNGFGVQGQNSNPNQFGGNQFGGNQFGGNQFGGNQFGQVTNPGSPFGFPTNGNSGNQFLRQTNGGNVFPTNGNAFQGAGINTGFPGNQFGQQSNGGNTFGFPTNGNAFQRPNVNTGFVGNQLGQQNNGGNTFGFPSNGNAFGRSNANSGFTAGSGNAFFPTTQLNPASGSLGTNTPFTSGTAGNGNSFGTGSQLGFPTTSSFLDRFRQFSSTPAPQGFNLNGALGSNFNSVFSRQRAGNSFLGQSAFGNNLFAQQNNFANRFPGGSFGQQGNVFGQQGNTFGQQGNVFGQQGNVFGQQGSIFGQQGNAFGQQGNGFGQQGNTFGQRGNAFGQQGNAFGQQGNAFGQQGNAFGGGNQLFPGSLFRQANLSPFSGVSFSGSRGSNVNSFNPASSGFQTPTGARTPLTGRVPGSPTSALFGGLRNQLRAFSNAARGQSNNANGFPTANGFPAANGFQAASGFPATGSSFSPFAPSSSRTGINGGGSQFNPLRSSRVNTGSSQNPPRGALTSSLFASPFSAQRAASG